MTTFRTRTMTSLLCLALATQPLLSIPATANQAPRSEAENDLFQYDQLIKQSEIQAPGQPKGSFAPDRFLLLDQEAVVRTYVGRSMSLFKNRVERELETHRSRINRLDKLIDRIEDLRGTHAAPADNACEGLTNAALDTSFLTKSAILHLDEGRTKDTPVFIWNFKGQDRELQCIQARLHALKAEWNNQTEDLWRSRASLTEVPNITRAPEKVISRFYNWWDVSVNVLDREDGSIIQSLQMARSADRSAMDDNNYNCPTGDTCRFSLNAKGQVLNRFHIPAKSIVTLGPYVAWIHENSHDAEGNLQYISFIDLATYGPALGQSDIPVFRVPIAMDRPATRLEASNEKLKVGDTSISVESLMMASEIQQAAFNLTANLVDPSSIAEVLPYIDGLQDAISKLVKLELADTAGEGESVNQAKVLFNKLGQDVVTQLSQNKVLAEFAAGKRQTLTSEQLQALPDAIRSYLTEYSRNVSQSEVLNKRLSAVTGRIALSRTLKSRMQLFFNRLTSPVPNASLKIKRALVVIGAQPGVKQGGISAALVDRPWLTSTLILAGAYSYIAPEQAYALSQGGLAIGNAVFDYLKFAVLGVAEGLSAGTKATFGPIVDWGASFSKQYLGDNTARSLIGVSSFMGVLFSIYMIPHMIFNLQKVLVDYRKPDWGGFVEHQRRLSHEYYGRLAEDEGRRRIGHGDMAFSQEELAEIREFLDQRSEQKKPTGMVGRAWRATADSWNKLRSAVGMSKTVKEKDPEKIKGWTSALLSLSFSFPAMELTLGRWARAWNWFAGARYTSFGFLTLRDLGLKLNMPIFVRVKPVTSGIRMLFPDFFNTVVAKRSMRETTARGYKTVPIVTVPTALNGGMRTWNSRDWIKLREGLIGKPSAVREIEEDAARELTASEFNEMSEDFERAILNVEDAVFKVAFKAALHKLTDFIANKKELLELFTQKPLKSIVERRVVDLPSEVRTFLRLYFEEIYQATMTEYMDGLIRAEGPTAEEQLEAADGKPLPKLAELKQSLLERRSRKAATQRAFNFDIGQAENIARRFTADDAIYNRVAKQARKGELSFHNFLVNRKYNVIADFDPEQNGSMKRFVTVQERLKSPNALSRAVRAEISKLLVTAPINLFLKMVMAAGIFEGVFKPIQDEFLGPNSVFYMSRATFYMGFAAGFVISMMADAWSKLQMDARQDEMGDFGILPQGEDAEKGFLRWFNKQLGDKNNTLMQNWHFANSVSFWNFPAALVNMGLFYYAFSGRLDLSYIIGGYILAFGTPASAFYYKLENAFERASEYPSRGIKDEKWLAHPGVQQAVTREKQRLRNQYNLLSTVYNDIQANLFANIEVIKTSYGTRGFVRAVFGGPLLEEAIVNYILTPAKTATQNIPGVGSVIETIANGCENVLTYGNKDLTGIKK